MDTRPPVILLPSTLVPLFPFTWLIPPFTPLAASRGGLHDAGVTSAAVASGLAGAAPPADPLRAARRRAPKMRATFCRRALWSASRRLQLLQDHGMTFTHRQLLVLFDAKHIYLIEV